MQHAGRPVSLLCIAIVTAVTFTGCVGGIPEPGPAATPVTLVLKWYHQAQFAGSYMAQQEGFYRIAGLEVGIIEGDPSFDVPAMVAGGEADFGITSVAQLLKARAAGHHVVAVAAIYQKSPVAFFAFAETNITLPQHLEGRSVAFSPTHEPFLRAMFENLGLDMATVRQAPFSSDLTSWYEGIYDVQAGYVMNQPVDARLATGREVTIIFPDDWGVHVYDDIVIVRESMIQEEPALVQGFLGATLRGWEEALRVPEAAIALTLLAKPGLHEVKEREFFLASAPLIQTGLRPIGWMDAEYWRGAAAMLTAQGVVPPGIEADQAYTMAFLEAYYGHPEAPG